MSASSDYLRVLTDITREGGATRAATQRANSQIWGNAVAKLGDFASDAVKQYGIDKKVKKQEEKDKAWEDLFRRAQAEFEAQQQPSMAELTGGAPTTTETYTPGGLQGSFAGTVPQSHVTSETTAAPQTFTGPELKNARPPRSSPFPTPSELLSVGGPERAVPVINAWVALQKLGQGNALSPKETAESLATFYRGFKNLTETQKRDYYPQALQLFESTGAVPPGKLPRQWDAQTEAFLEGTGTDEKSTNHTEWSFRGDLSSKDPAVVARAQTALDSAKSGKDLPTSVEALKTIAANAKDPRQAEAAAVLEALPDSVRITGPEMDEKYRKIMAKPSKARTGDEVAWAGAYERQKAVSQPAVVIQTDQGPRLLDRKNRTADVITTPEGDTVNAPPTQPQAQDATFAKRLGDAGAVLDRLAPKIAKMSLLEYEAQLRLPAAAQSKDFQEYDQAARNLINSILRRESGAAIASSEFADARRQYLAQPGNGPDVLKQKLQNRERQRQGLIKGAGPVYTPDTPDDRVRVKGPNGERGTMLKSEPLPSGWSKE